MAISALMLILALLVGVFPTPLDSSTLASASDTTPVVFAYGIMITGNGSWIGIEPASVEMPQILSSGATYVEVADSSTCRTNTGVPNSATSGYFTQLKQAGIHLGVRLALQNNCTTSVFIAKAQFLLKSGWYDWIFLDGALTNTDLQYIVNQLLLQGWTKITENDSRLGTVNAVVPPATGEGRQLPRFCLLSPYKI